MPANSSVPGDLVERIISRDAVRSEATLQADVRQLLLSGTLHLEDDQVVNLEVPLADGTRRRIDIEAGSAVIEVKRDLRKGHVLDDAIDQLAGYVHYKNSELGRRYVGVLTDGKDWYLFNLDSATRRLTEVSRHTVTSVEDADDLLVWLEIILATVDGVQPSPVEIERRLGVTSPAYRLDHQGLRSIYDASANDPEVKLKRKLWARLLRTAFGSSFTDDANLFVDHTLLVLEASIIAHAVVGLDLTDAEIQPDQLIRGGQFTNAQINNVVEGDFFDWVLRSEAGRPFVRGLVRQLRRFAWANVEHDVLKVLYESVINAATRKRLGEYYTPDWLAERMLEQVVDDPLHQRVLDPACGSGTFVFHAVRRYLLAAERAGISNADALNGLQGTVFGMDIHPVSVVLARVTYLMAIGRERLTSSRGPITVPVYLGDSMQWSRDASTVDESTMKVEIDAQDLAPHEAQPSLFSAGRVLAFPLASIDEPAVFDRLVADLVLEAHRYFDTKKSKPSIQHLLNRYGIVDTHDRETLTATFSVLCELNAHGENHIWGYFVRNQVRPLWFGLTGSNVDILIGNPPWVAFRYMTQAMQAQFKRFSEARGLWAGGRVATTQDLVGLFIARSVEQYVGVGGKFAFVAPKAVLSRMQYEGFRTGRWGSNLASVRDNTSVSVRAAFEVLWEMGAIRPAMFPVPSAAIFGTRVNTASPMPREVHTISGNLPSRSVRLAVASRIINEEVRSVAAVTLDGAVKSPYARTAFQGAIFSPRLLFFVTERSAGPLGTSQGVRPIESYRTTLEHSPWKELPSQVGRIEAPFIREVLMGATLAPYRTLKPWRAVLPIADGKLLSDDDIRDHWHLDKWWSNAKEVWERHKKPQSKLTLRDQLDYQGKLSRQLGKGGNRIVYVASGSSLAAARIADPELIIDNSLYWLRLSDVDAARYLVAILNSGSTLERIRPLQSEGLYGPRHFHKLVWSLPIPVYDPSNSKHVELSKLAGDAEDLVKSIDVGADLSFKQVRGVVRRKLAASGLEEAVDALVAALVRPESARE